MIPLADLTAEEVHYNHKTVTPGSYKTGVLTSYDLSDDDLSVEIEASHDPEAFVVLVNHSAYLRTAVGAYWVALSSADWRYWTEADYVDNVSTMKHYKTMAEKLAGAQDVVDQYHIYEKDFVRLETYPHVFFDGIGETGYWPNDVRPLLTTLQDRMRVGVPTVVSLDPAATERIPEWDRILSSSTSVIIDLGEH